MQIRPTSVRLVQLNFGLSMYLDRTFRLSLSLSRNFGLRPKFPLSKRLSEITSLFDLSLVLDRTLPQQKAQRKAKSKSEVAHCMQHYLMLSRGKFYAKKRHSNKVLQLGAKGSGNYASPCTFVICSIFYITYKL